MPRGRKAEVRYFFDDSAGKVIAVSRGEVRVLEEVGARRRAGRPPKEATETPPVNPDQPRKPRGRPRKKKTDE